MLETPYVTDSAAQHAAVIHLTIPRAEIRAAMGPGIGELMAAIAAQGVAPVGPWFSHHLKMDPGTFDFEIGVPVAGPVASAGRVAPGRLPAARVARAVYQGPYEALSAAWGELGAWIAERGLTPGADLWEVYLVGPDATPDATAWRTELNRPLVV